MRRARAPASTGGTPRAIRRSTAIAIFWRAVSASCPSLPTPRAKEPTPRIGSSPGHAATAVLRGRAYAGLKDYPHALIELERARAIDSRSLDDPATLRDLARVLSRSGRGSEALVVYRALGPRLALFPSTDERAKTFLEGAELAFALGSSALDDAIAFLSEAKQLAVRDLAVAHRVRARARARSPRPKDEAASLALDLGRRLRKESLPVTTRRLREIFGGVCRATGRGRAGARVGRCAKGIADLGALLGARRRRSAMARSRPKAARGLKVARGTR